MLIKTHQPIARSTQAATSKAEVLAKKLENKELSVEDLYSGGSWQLSSSFADVNPEHLGRNQAINVMQNAHPVSATYTIPGAKGAFESLSKFDQGKRRVHARDEAIVKGAGTAVAGGMLLTGGLTVAGVLGSVGSLVTRTGGGGLGVGLGTISAIAGIAGLAIGVSTYLRELGHVAPAIVQTGKAVVADNGFRFSPSSYSPDQRAVTISADSVVEV